MAYQKTTLKDRKSGKVIHGSNPGPVEEFLFDTPREREVAKRDTSVFLKFTFTWHSYLNKNFTWPMYVQ